jgi:mono/diheme cytochrome c family protein
MNAPQVTAKRIRVFIPTSQGPVEIQSIRREMANVPNSFVSINGTTDPAGIDEDYHRFVVSASGVIERTFGHNRFRVDVSAPLDCGKSWQLGMFVAHALEREGRLAVHGGPADAILWVSGEVRDNLSVTKVGSVPDKLDRSADLFSELRRYSVPVVICLPAANMSDEDAGTRLATLGDQRLAVNIVDDVLAVLGLRTVVAAAASQPGGAGRAADGPGPKTRSRLSRLLAPLAALLRGVRGALASIAARALPFLSAVASRLPAPLRPMRVFLPVSAGVLALAFYAAGFVVFAPPSIAGLDAPLAGDEASVLERGKYVFNASGCASCHAGKSGATAGAQASLGGGYRIETPVGTLVVPNISNDPVHGIGAWSEEDFVRAVKLGRSPDGSFYYPAFPYAAYAGMATSDARALFKYVKSLPADPTPRQDHELGFPFNIRAGLFAWRLLNYPGPSEPENIVNPNPLQLGKYLVENLAHCAECHTPRSLTLGLDQSQAYKGGSQAIGGVVPPSIATAKLCAYSVGDFVASTFEKAQKLSGAPYTSPEMREVAANMMALGQQDREAIHAYLTSLNGGCASSPPAPGLVAGGNPAALEPGAEAVIKKHCVECHSPGGRSSNALAAWSFSSMAALKDDPKLKRVFSQVSSGAMPQFEALVPEQSAPLLNWISSLENAGAKPGATASGPSLSVVSVEQIRNAASADLSAVPAEFQANIRYVSFAHLRNAWRESEAAWDKELKILIDGVTLGLNSLSREPTLMKPVTVEGTSGTLLRIDIQKLWGAKAAFKWELVAEAYEYATRPKSGGSHAALVQATGSDVPIVNADWLIAKATVFPLYNQLMDFGSNIKQLEAELGVDVNRNIEEFKVARAGFTAENSGVSDHNRLIERHDLPGGGYYWASYDFLGDAARQNLQQRPVGPVGINHARNAFEHDGGEFIFKLPNGLQGYALSDKQGNYLKSGPTDIVHFPDDLKLPSFVKPDIVNAVSCMQCHAEGIIPKADQIRPLVEGGATAETRKLVALLYPAAKDMAQIYKRDSQSYQAALRSLGIDRVSYPTTRDRRQEIVPRVADEYSDRLDRARFAAELGVREDQLETSVVASLGNALAQQKMQSMLGLLRAGEAITRDDFEALYPAIIEDVSDEIALHASDIIKLPDENERLVLQVKLNKKEFASCKVPPSNDPAQYKGCEQLEFELQSSKTCELNIIWQSVDGNKVLDEVVFGNRILAAGERRKVPQGSSLIPTNNRGQLLTDRLVIQCREGELGSRRLGPDDAGALNDKLLLLSRDERRRESIRAFTISIKP